VRRSRTVAALVVWGYGVWTLLTWTATVEFLVAGVLVASACALVSALLGRATAPWALLSPRRLTAELRLGWTLLVRVTIANIGMARRIWTPRLPVHTGIVEVTSRSRDTTRMAATGLLTSLVVDNQVVDLDPSTKETLYHCVDVPAESERYDEVLGHIEPLVDRL
jgi:multicomponent Na+:H+ antiporter subunit E